MIIKSDELIAYLLKNNGKNDRGNQYHEIYTFFSKYHKLYKVSINEKDSILFLRNYNAILLWSKKNGLTEHALNMFPRFRS